LKRILALLALAFALTASPLGAQDEAADDGTFLENWLEENLSSAGRDVQVRGFAGALSSQATLEELTIADDEGIWLILRRAELDWTRSALLTGRLEIDALRADVIEVLRRPASAAGGPKVAASPFALPELPVSIDIGRITADRVALGADVLGAEAVLRLEGNAQLEGGAGAATVTMERIDGRDGLLRLDGSYANDSRLLTLDLSLHEGPDGLAAALVNLPVGDEIDLTITGAGPIDNFDAAIILATAGTDRLTGDVRLRGIGAGETSRGGLGFAATLAGDPTPLLQPEYWAFFGNDARLELEGRLQDGLTEISTFVVDTDGLTLTGNAALSEGGWPTRLAVEGTVAHADGAAVRLPIATPTEIRNAELAIAYDPRVDDNWRATFRLDGLAQPGVSVGSATIRGTGTLVSREGDQPRVSGRIDISADDIAATDPDLATALGDSIAGSLRFDRSTGRPLRLSDIALKGRGFAVSGAVELATDISRLDVIGTGELGLQIDDLAQLAGLAGQPLTGAAEATLAGDVALPGGPFDLAIRGTAQDIGIGQDAVDPLFSGASSLAIDAARNEDGTRIDRFELASDQATATGAAVLNDGNSTVEAKITINSGASLAEGFDGPLVITAEAEQSGVLWVVDANGTAPGKTSLSARADVRATRHGLGPINATISASVANLAPYAGFGGLPLRGAVVLDALGSFAPETGDFAFNGTAQGRDLAIGNPTADALIGAKSDLTFAIRRDNGIAVLDRLDLSTQELTARAIGSGDGEMPAMTLSARLRDLGRVVPGLPGPASLEGTAHLQDGRWEISGDGAGPGGTSITIAGSVAADSGDPDLALRGRAPLAMANGAISPHQLAGMADFDLALTGGYGLPNVSGQLATSGARLSLPYLQTALDPIRATAHLGGGRANVNLDATVASGGRIAVSGPVRLAAPYEAALTIRLIETGVADPALFNTSLNGTVSLTGPLLGAAAITGRLGFGAIELRVPETGFGASGALPDLTHLAEPAAVRETRRRAGLLGAAGGGRGTQTPFTLDLTLDAPSQVFVRGRGLDAEFGGALRLRGTTAAVRPEGGFRLIRGRLDILGKRLVLTEGTITLQGDFDPYLRAVAETEANDTQVQITVEGLATAPAVTFSSSPDLPEDEILARLIFGRGLDEISPFQALRLASAVATLAGRGGAGLVERLRGNFGLDDLDVTTDSEGNLAARAGTYITDNIYTDVTVSPQGNTEINLNLTITPNLTVRGNVATDGGSGIGVFYERDY